MKGCNANHKTIYYESTKVGPKTVSVTVHHWQVGDIRQIVRHEQVYRFDDNLKQVYDLERYVIVDAPGKAGDMAYNNRSAIAAFDALVAAYTPPMYTPPIPAPDWVDTETDLPLPFAVQSEDDDLPF